MLNILSFEDKFNTKQFSNGSKQHAIKTLETNLDIK